MSPDPERVARIWQQLLTQVDHNIGAIEREQAELSADKAAAEQVWHELVDILHGQIDRDITA